MALRFRGLSDAGRLATFDDDGETVSYPSDMAAEYGLLPSTAASDIMAGQEQIAAPVAPPAMPDMRLAAGRPPPPPPDGGLASDIAGSGGGTGHVDPNLLKTRDMMGGEAHVGHAARVQRLIDKHGANSVQVARVFAASKTGQSQEVINQVLTAAEQGRISPLNGDVLTPRAAAMLRAARAAGATEGSVAKMQLQLQQADLDRKVIPGAPPNQAYLAGKGMLDEAPVRATTTTKNRLPNEAADALYDPRIKEIDEAIAALPEGAEGAKRQLLRMRIQRQEMRLKQLGLDQDERVLDLLRRRYGIKPGKKDEPEKSLADELPDVSDKTSDDAASDTEEMGVPMPPDLPPVGDDPGDLRRVASELDVLGASGEALGGPPPPLPTELIGTEQYQIGDGQLNQEAAQILESARANGATEETLVALEAQLRMSGKYDREPIRPDQEIPGASRQELEAADDAALEEYIGAGIPGIGEDGQEAADDADVDALAAEGIDPLSDAASDVAGPPDPETAMAIDSEIERRIAEAEQRQIEEKQKRVDEINARMAETRQRARDQLDAVAQMRVDPSRLFRGQGGARFAAVLSGILGGFLQGMGRTPNNAGLDNVTQMINDDIEQQKVDYERGKEAVNAYSEQLALWGGDERIAKESLAELMNLGAHERGLREAYAAGYLQVDSDVARRAGELIAERRKLAEEKMLKLLGETQRKVETEYMAPSAGYAPSLAPANYGKAIEGLEFEASDGLSEKDEFVQKKFLAESQAALVSLSTAVNQVKKAGSAGQLNKLLGVDKWTSPKQKQAADILVGQYLNAISGAGVSDKERAAAREMAEGARRDPASLGRFTRYVETTMVKKLAGYRAALDPKVLGKFDNNMKTQLRGMGYTPSGERIEADKRERKKPK